MPFTANVGDQIVDLQTGAKFKVADAPLDLDEKRYGRVLGDLQATPGQIRGGAQGLVENKPALIPPEAAARGAQRAGEEASRFSGAMTRNVAVPLAQAGLGLATGGMSLPYQALIGGGAELAGQLINRATGGRAPTSVLGVEAPPEIAAPAQIGVAAAIPAAARGLFSALKSTGNAAMQLVGPAAVREAGTEAVAKIGGQAADVVERAFAKPLSGRIYDMARKAGNLPTANLKTSIDDAIMAESKLGNPDRMALRKLSGISRKFATNQSTTFDDAINEVQRLEAEASKAFKGKNNVTGKTLADAADAMAQEISKTNPAYSQAVNRYLRERTTTKVLDAIREGNSAAKLNKLIDHEAGRVSKAFSKAELNEIRQVAGQIAEAAGSGGEGFANRTFNALTKPFSDMLESKTGRALLRNTLGGTGVKGKLTSAAMASALQFWRAYQAQGGDQ